MRTVECTPHPPQTEVPDLGCVVDLSQGRRRKERRSRGRSSRVESSEGLEGRRVSVSGKKSLVVPLYTI